LAPQIQERQNPATEAYSEERAQRTSQIETGRRTPRRKTKAWFILVGRKEGSTQPARFTFGLRPKVKRLFLRPRSGENIEDIRQHVLCFVLNEENQLPILSQVAIFPWETED